MTISGYHHPRFYRTAPMAKWQGVGVANCFLAPVCTNVAAGVTGYLEVKLSNNQIVRIRKLSPERIMQRNARKYGRELTREGVEYVPQSLADVFGMKVVIDPTLPPGVVSWVEHNKRSSCCDANVYYRGEKRVCVSCLSVE